MVEDQDRPTGERERAVPDSPDTRATALDDTDAPETNQPGAAGDRELEAMQAEIASLTDRHLRLAAEFDNYRKRTERERAEQYARAQGELVKRLLEPIDDLERVSDYTDATAAVLLEGVQLVEKKLLQNLQAAGLETIDPAGQPFDPNAMEAVGVVATEDSTQDGLVADVFQKGYRFSGQLVRPARVRVYQQEG
jgi:molecular chaperone GrpE